MFRKLDAVAPGRAAQTTLRRVAAEYLENTFTGVTREDYEGFIRCLQHIVDRLNPTEVKDEKTGDA